jgi:hypothetical protein
MLVCIGENSIFSSLEEGPSFGLFDIRIAKDFLNDESSCYLYSYGYSLDKSEFNGGDRKFLIKDIELFHVTMVVDENKI